MRRRRAVLLAITLVALLASHAPPARAATPVLRANVSRVDIRDGDRFLRGAWNVDPTLALDRYDARRSDAERRITFLSDVDSISFEVKPGETVDFVILLAGRDSCRTRISAARLGPVRAGTGRTAAGVADTIPFRLRDGRIHVQARINGSAPISLMYDTGATISCIRPAALERGVKLVFDGSGVSRGFGGTTTRQTSSDNRIEVAGLTWDHEPILSLGKQRGENSEGILGSDVFANKVLVIDYDRGVLVVSDSLPDGLEAYARLPLRDEGSVPLLEATFDAGGKPDRGWFVLDTGASAPLQLTHAFVTEHGFSSTLRRLGSSTSGGVGGGRVRNVVVALPTLALGKFALHDVPTHLEAATGAPSLSSGCLLGMEVLSRFNIVIDDRHQQIYLKPNARFHERFPAAGGPPLLALGFAAAFAALVILWGFGARRRRTD